MPAFSMYEWAYKAEGASVVTQMEYVNTKVKEYPAILMEYRAPSGKAYTSLSWHTPDKFYELTYSGSVKGTPHEKFLYEVAVGIAQ